MERSYSEEHTMNARNMRLGRYDLITRWGNLTRFVDGPDVCEMSDGRLVEYAIASCGDAGYVARARIIGEQGIDSIGYITTPGETVRTVEVAKMLNMMLGVSLQ